MAKADGSVTIEILGDDKDITSKLSGVAEKAASGLKTAFVGTTAAVGAATVAVGAFAKQSLDGYANYEQLVGGVETLFGAGGKTIEQYAESVGKTTEAVQGEFDSMMSAQKTVLDNAANAYQTAGMSANDYMETVTGFSASLIQSLGGDTGKAAQVADQAITDMSDNANKMGTSMESIQYAYQGFAKQNYTMLDNLKIGYGGTKEEMERLLQDAEKLSGVEYDISSFADVAEAIHVVQTEMGITGTTAAEASSTIQGSVNAAGAAWQNLVTGIADENADLSGLIDNFVSSAETAASNIIPRITQILSGMGAAIQEIAPIIAEQLPAMIEQVAPSLVGAGAQLLTGLVTGIASALPSLAASLPAIVQSIGEAFVAAAPSLQAAGTQLLEMLKAGITQGIPALAANAPAIISGIVSGISGAVSGLASAGGEIISALSSALSAAGPDLAAAGEAIMDALKGAISSGASALAENGPEIITALVSAITGAVSLILDVGGEIIGALISAISSAVPKLLESGPEIISTLASGIASVASDLLDTGAHLIAEVVSGIASAIPDIVQQAPAIVAALAGGILGIASQLLETGKSLLVELGNGIVSAIPESVTDKASEIVDGLKSGITNFAGNVVSSGKELVSKVGEGISSAISQAITWGGDLIDNFVSGIRNGIGKVTGAVSAVADKIKALIGFSEPDEGPLSDFHTYAPDMMELFADGILENKGLIEDAFNKTLEFAGRGVANAANKMADQAVTGMIEGIENAGNAMTDMSLTGMLADEVEALEKEADALKRSAEAEEKFYDNLDRLKERNAPSELVDQLEAANAGAAVTLENLVNMTDDELDNYIALFEKKLAIKSDATDTAIASLEKNVLSQFSNMSAAEMGDAQEAIRRQSEKSLDEALENSSKFLSQSRKNTQQSEKDQETLDKQWFEYMKKRLEDETKEKELSLQEQYRGWKTIQDQFFNSQEYYTQAEDKLTELKEQMQDEYYDKVKQTLQNIEALEEDYQKQLSDRVREIQNEYGLFTEVRERDEVSGSQLAQNLKDQIATLEEFYTNLEALAERGAPEELVSQIRGMGVDAVAELAALVNMSDEELAEYGELFAEKNRFAVEQAAKELAPLRAETDAKIQEQLDSVKGLYDTNVGLVGEAFTGGLTESILDGLDDVSDAAQEVVLKSLQAAEQAADSFDLSWLSDNITDQLKNAVESSAGNLSANLTVASNAPAEARAARDRTNAYQTAAANAAVNGDSLNNATFIYRMDSTDFYRGSLKNLRTVEAETPETLDDN